MPERSEPNHHSDQGAPRQADRADRDVSIPDTFISLIVAFVIAMTFRGFVLEGFVIPTGSMAPTLLGEHILARSPETGYVFRADSGHKFLRPSAPDESYMVLDPLTGRSQVLEEPTWAELVPRTRAGDRVLVLKWFYNFFDPKRYDVIVFKNPTESRENYIKRLAGLPGEEVWLADGDVFTRDAGETDAPFEIRRKPMHVQRAVWRPVYDSLYAPRAFEYHDPFPGLARAEGDPFEFRIDSATETTLHWNGRTRPIDDWNAYNMLGESLELTFPVSDLRVVAQLTPDQNNFVTRFRLRARGYLFEYEIAEGAAAVRMRPFYWTDADGWDLERTAKATPFSAGSALTIEFWHVDQALSILINSKSIVSLDYNWRAADRLERATGRSVDDVLESEDDAQPWARDVPPSEPDLEWSLSGSPVTIHRIRVDRDLYYQPDYVGDATREPGLGTHPRRTAILGPDHFYVLGDNSAHSLDSRKWGEPDAIIVDQIDEAPFVVNRKLILGKAWCVYFPAPYSLTEEGARFIPDLGRLRFIR